MYKIVIRNSDGCKELLAESHDDLRAIVTLAPEAEYEIVRMEKQEGLQTVTEFLEEIKDKIKPKDLVFGVDEDGTAYTGDPLDEITTNTAKESADVQVDNTNQKED